MLYKQFVYVKIPIEQSDKSKQPMVRIEPLRKALLECGWSKHETGCGVNEIFMNIENMSIFKKGVIGREVRMGESWQVEIAQTIPVVPSVMVRGTKFQQSRNSINYSFEKITFYSQPEQLFESFGYKTTSKTALRGFEYFYNHIKGIEVYLFEKQAYLKIVETYPKQIDPEYRVSAARDLLLYLQPYLSLEQVFISASDFLPEDYISVIEE